MNPQRAPQFAWRPTPALRAASSARTTYEWEELPSLSGGLRRPQGLPHTAPAWRMTQPMSLGPMGEPEPEPFREVLLGLHVREILGDEVFEHFFGALPRRG